MGPDTDGLLMTDEKIHPEVQRFLDAMRAKYTDLELERIDRSWGIQTRETCKRRLEAVIQLSIELGKIREIDPFATRFGSAAIEELIKGDLMAVLRLAGDMDFKDEREDLQARYGPIWAKFRDMALAAAQPDEAIQ